MAFFDGHSGPYTLLALSVALAAYSVLFLHNLFRSKKDITSEESKTKSKNIIELLQPQVVISLFLMLVLLLRIIVSPLASECLLGCIDILVLLVLFILWMLMCCTAWVSYLADKSTYFTIKEAMPMDKKHADELRNLAKQGLCKINIRGVGDHDLTVVVHKNVPYKISRDFVGNGDEVSVFLDRSSDRPAECHLYKSSCPMPTIFLMDDEFEEKRKAEDELLENCAAMVVKKTKP